MAVVTVVGWIVSGIFEPSTDEIGSQMVRVEKSISERGGSQPGVREFTDLECRRFDELEPGRTTTCTSAVVRDGGTSGRAEITVTLTECENTGGGTEFATKGCEFSWEYTIAD